MSIEQEAAELLERAADGYESGRYYWTRGQYSRMVFGTRAYCSLGALGHEMGQVVIGSHPVLDQAVLSLAAQVASVDPMVNPGHLVVTWNDHVVIHLGGKADVIEAMKQAAKELRNTTGETV